MPSEAELLTLITALETRIATFAGVRSNAFSDQSITFSLDDAHKELARLRSLYAVTVSGGSATRYAATSKGV